ncbi:MAG: TOBE domain-containing protein [Deltaproteobacteria bacterium]|nr:TOBE domain-containing protein [Deltaproteobacteria bacterium]
MNKLKGIISRIDKTDHIALIQVKVGEDHLSSVILSSGEDEPRVGEEVFILFKETEVSIGKDLRGGLSMRNRLEAVIVSIEKGPVLSKIGLGYKGHTIFSVITTSSAENLGLKPGDQVEGLIKSNEVTLMAVE